MKTNNKKFIKNVSTAFITLALSTAEATVHHYDLHQCDNAKNITYLDAMCDSGINRTLFLGEFMEGIAPLILAGCALGASIQCCHFLLQKVKMPNLTTSAKPMTTRDNPNQSDDSNQTRSRYNEARKVLSHFWKKRMPVTDLTAALNNGAHYGTVDTIQHKPNSEPHIAV